VALPDRNRASGAAIAEARRRPAGLRRRRGQPPHAAPLDALPKTENRSVGQTHYTIETFLRQLDADPVANMPVFICDRRTGQYIGGTGLHSFVHATHQAECGYWVSQDRRGSGVCSEAVVALTELALRPQPDGGLGLRRLEICCSADNAPSAGVARKAGYQLEATLRAHRWLDGIGWSDTLVYATTADTWTTP
jgi:RimJ/RimL family protein N-acetyltransferase